MKSKFIVIEGIDGAGKSTQIDLLDQALVNHGIQHYTTHEASDGPIGKILREEYLSGKRKCDERVINKLYAADRLDHITNEEDGILKHLRDGDQVICDRYVLSSLAYDIYPYIDSDGYIEELNRILDANQVNLELLNPDITLVLDIPTKVALDRIKARDETASVYETEEKLDRIREAYRRSIAILRLNHKNVNYGSNITILDATLPIDELHFKIWDIVSSVIREE